MERHHGILQASLFIPIAIVVFACGQSARASSAEDVVMEGQFTWNMGGDEPTELQARFTPTADGEWAATFDFRFNGSRHRWHGTVRGNLVNGDVEGVVSWGRGRRTRTWELRGKSNNGNLSAAHSERNRNGQLQPSGRIELKTNQLRPD